MKIDASGLLWLCRVKTMRFNTEDVGSISGQRAKIPLLRGKKKKKDPAMRERRRGQSALKMLLWEMLWLLNLLRVQGGLVSLTGFSTYDFFS